MLAQENAPDFARVGGVEISQHDNVLISAKSPEIKQKIEIAELVGSLRFVVDNLDQAAREATVAADAICDKNIMAGRYHIQRFAAHARAAVGAFRDVLDRGAP